MGWYVRVGEIILIISGLNLSCLVACLRGQGVLHLVPGVSHWTVNKEPIHAEA